MSKVHLLKNLTIEWHSRVSKSAEAKKKFAKAKTFRVKDWHKGPAALAVVLKKFVGDRAVDQRALRRLVMEWIEVMDRDQSG